MVYDVDVAGRVVPKRGEDQVAAWIRYVDASLPEVSQWRIKMDEFLAQF